MMSLKRVLAICLALALLLSGCSGLPFPSDKSSFKPDYWPTAGWRSSTPEEQGMDSEQLAQTLDWIASKDLNLHSLLIVRNGYLVTETYFHPYSADTRGTIQSVTKSVIGMLVGMAIDQGQIKGTNERLLSFFPGRAVANLDPDKEAITLADMLSLTAGLTCNDMPGSGTPSMVESAHWAGYMLDQPMAGKPGEKFNYCSGVVHLLSAVLRQATGTDPRDLANEQLFAPLGIPPVTPEQWATDPDGLPIGGYGLKLTPREMAKLGYLYLNRGRWDGKQIVPAKWVAASTRQHITKEDGSGYGYLWTVWPDEGAYAALGLAGQYIYVVPSLNLVVVLTGAVNDIGLTSDGYLTLRELLAKHIVPAAQSPSPLPANAAGVARLADQIQRAANPVQPVPPLPVVAAEISGKTYHVDKQWGTVTSFSLDFTRAPNEAVVTFDDSEHLVIGLDNLYYGAETAEAKAGIIPVFRGRWEDANTFVADELILGELVEVRLTLTFAGDQVAISQEDAIFGGTQIELVGRQ